MGARLFPWLHMGATAPESARRASVNSVACSNRSEEWGHSSRSGWLDDEGSEIGDTDFRVSNSSQGYDSLPPHMRTALLAYESSKSREPSSPKLVHHHPHSKCQKFRHKLHRTIETSSVQSILVLLIIVEMLAVSGETLIERGWLDFDGPRDPGDPSPINNQVYNVLHIISISILVTFEIEFLLMLYAEGARCCCQKRIAWILLDAVIVTMALIVEIFYRYFKYEMLGDDEKLSDASVVFVLSLRIIRIVNGLVQQHLRNIDINSKLIAHHEEHIAERYLEQVRHMIQQSDTLQEELIYWKEAARSSSQRVRDLELLSKVQTEQLSQGLGGQAEAGLVKGLSPRKEL